MADDDKPQDDTKPEPTDDAPEAPEPGEDGGEPGTDPEPFDPDRARAALTKKNSENANLRRRLKELEPLAAKAKELEDASKSELEKLTDRTSAAEKQATESGMGLLRLEVALDKAPEGVSLAQVRKLAKRLSGSTREELEEDAEELFSDLAPAGGSGRPPSKRPTEALRGGANPEQEPEKDPADLADAVLKRRRGF